MTLKEFRMIRNFIYEMEQLMERKPLADPKESKAREIQYCKQLENMVGK